jgi:hypothetical protein
MVRWINVPISESLATRLEKRCTVALEYSISTRSFIPENSFRNGFSKVAPWSKTSLFDAGRSNQ